MKTATKILKKIAIWVGISLGVCVLIFILSRYGWRVFGYNMCDSIRSNWIDEATFEDDQIILMGETADSISSFVGYKYTVKDGNLYLGLKHNMLFGFFNRLGGFHIVIPESGIQNIYLKDRTGERLVWNVDEGRIPIK